MQARAPRLGMCVAVWEGDGGRACWADPSASIWVTCCWFALVMLAVRRRLEGTSGVLEAMVVEDEDILGGRL